MKMKHKNLVYNFHLKKKKKKKKKEREREQSKILIDSLTNVCIKTMIFKFTSTT